MLHPRLVAALLGLQVQHHLELRLVQALLELQPVVLLEQAIPLVLPDQLSVAEVHSVVDLHLAAEVLLL